jgi:hypothetical protein
MWSPEDFVLCGTIDIEYVGEFQVVCEKALGCETEAWLEIFDGKNQRSNILPHYSFMPGSISLNHEIRTAMQEI